MRANPVTEYLPWRLNRHERRDVVKGLTFISPWLLGFLAFMAYPIGASLYYSFTEYDILTSPRLVVHPASNLHG